MRKFKEFVQVLGQDTLIPLGFVILILGGIGNWVWQAWKWSTALETQATAMNQRFSDHVAEDGEHDVRLVEELKTERQLLGSIDHRLSIIEGEMKRIRR